MSSGSQGVTSRDVWLSDSLSEQLCSTAMLFRYNLGFGLESRLEVFSLPVNDCQNPCGSKNGSRKDWSPKIECATEDRQSKRNLSAKACLGVTSVGRAVAVGRRDGHKLP